MHNQIQCEFIRSPIGTCSTDNMQMKVNLELSRGQRDLLDSQEREREARAELSGMVQSMAKNMEDLMFILQRTNPNAIEGVMQSFQEVRSPLQQFPVS